MPTPLPHRVHPPRAGFTLAELTLALAVLVIAVGGTLGTLSAYVRLDRQDEGRARAIRAAEGQLERMRAEPFADLFERYNDTAADDPVGPGVLPSPGSDFAVPGLDAQPGDPDGAPGRVTFPVDAAAPGVLREDLPLPELGTPLDLNMDGVIDGDDRRDDHVLLPVRVEVRWNGPAGLQSVSLDSTLAPR